jgi:hypothetical protein
MSTSVAYLRKRLTDIGRQDLLDAVDVGAISTFAAAEEAGLVTRQPILGTGSPNAAKKRVWAISKITRQTPPLGPTPASTPTHSKFSRGMPRNGRSAPTTPVDLAAAIREWEEAQRPALPRRNDPRKQDEEILRERKPAPAVLPKPEELAPFPVHPALPCTNCRHSQAVTALKEVVDLYLAACRGEPHRTGSVLPRACCQWLRRPDIRALIA